MDLTGTKLSTVIRAAAWVCVILLAMFSLMPGEWRTHLSWASGKLEHFTAYFGTTVCVGLAYWPRLGRRPVALSLMIYAAIMEAGQVYVPSRTASVWDFCASATGVLAGAVVLPLAKCAFVAALAVVSRR
jgi:VanZ family protein